MGSVGTPEILLILVIALLLFGPQKLPELGKSLGRAVREFKKASQELQETIEREVEDLGRQVKEEPRRPGLPQGALPPPTHPQRPPEGTGANAQEGAGPAEAARPEGPAEAETAGGAAASPTSVEPR